MNTQARFLHWDNTQEMDRSILLGIIVSFALISLAIVAGGQIFNFFDWKGLLLVVGGTFGATLANFSLRDLSFSYAVLRESLVMCPPPATDRIRHFVRLSQAVRAQGLLALENEAARTHDTFLKKALELTVDGQPADDVRRILETDLRSSHEHETRAVQVFEALGSFAPALGLIGTLVGLIQMLGQLQDPATVGPAMSIALVTTLYGAMLANLVFLPIAGKLKLRNEADWVLKSMSIEGVISLGKQENPIMLEQRLLSFLPSNGNGAR